MAMQSVDVPDGYTLLPVLVPTVRVQDYIDTYANQGGYSPTIHGATAAQKAIFAKQVLATSLDNAVMAYKNSLIVASAMAETKTIIP